MRKLHLYFCAATVGQIIAGTVCLAGSAGDMAREVQIRGRTAVIDEGATPHEAQLTIDGVHIPLVYNEGFAGWGVEHTIYGFFPDLELLANHMIVSNPSLEIGHGGGGHHDQ